MVKRRMLDLFCGRGGWTNAFLERGWECVGVDIVRDPDYRGTFYQEDVGDMGVDWLSGYDFVCASSPCEKFSVFDMKFWFKNPPYPGEGVRLFNHTKMLCREAGVPHIMENVRAAQRFVGKAVNHCGPFYLWGDAVPPILPQGITKGSMLWSEKYRNMKKSQRKREVATIPPELANCVADYAERLLEVGEHGT